MESSSEAAALSFGKSIIVPSVQELVKDSVVKIPPRYERFDQDSVVESCCLLSVPVIDLQRLAANDSMDSELQILHSACRDWGFFQVVNHGVSNNLVEQVKLEIEKLFKIPYEEKKKLWQQADNQEGFGQLFVVSEDQKLDWSDMFYITTLPSHLRMLHLFNNLPPNLRETLESYINETKRVAMEILDHMAEGLKMEVKEMRELFDDGVQSMRMNYYPPCPEPEKAIGFAPHSDADALTILFQLNETQGLQIRKDGSWVSVKPLPNAFVVNIGDIMEIVSNGAYKSVEHRATVNSGKERLSIATFYSAKLDSVLGPAKSLVGPHNPPIFRQVPLDKYFKDFFARKLNGKSFVDFMRVADAENM